MPDALTPDELAAIADAERAGKVQYVPRGVSGETLPVWDEETRTLKHPTYDRKQWGYRGPTKNPEKPKKPRPSKATGKRAEQFRLIDERRVKVKALRESGVSIGNTAKQLGLPLHIVKNDIIAIQRRAKS